MDLLSFAGLTLFHAAVLYAGICWGHRRGYARGVDWACRSVVDATEHMQDMSFRSALVANSVENKEKAL